jgi:pyroglutamyl-peptidase
MVQASLDAGIPAQISNSAGTFVCNALMYRVLNMTEGTDTKAGFIHVPQTPAQAVVNTHPSMSPEIAAKGISAMIAAL